MKNAVVVFKRVIAVLLTPDTNHNARHASCARHYHDVYQLHMPPAPPSTTFRCYETTLARKEFSFIQQVGRVYTAVTLTQTQTTSENQGTN
ncbi:hypothetical protein J6590_095367 [Homalodisca vitripennis]|nr:hypothetical protein J6590_095367 [Homalodisca vitripennis]